MSCFCCCDFRGGITCNLVGNIALNIKKHVAVVATLNAILAYTITHSYSSNFARDMTRKTIGGTTCNLASNIAHYITFSIAYRVGSHIAILRVPLQVTSLATLHPILLVSLQVTLLVTLLAILRIT